LDPAQVLRGVLPPFVIAFVLLLAKLRRGGRDDGERGSMGALGALGLGLGTAVGAGFIVGALDPLLHPISMQHKLAWAALAGGLFGVVDQVLGTKSAARIALRTVLRFALPAAFLWWFLASRRVRAWSASEAWMWTSVFAAAIAALSVAIDSGVARRPGFSRPLALCAALAVAAGALVAFRVASYAQIAGSMSAALGGAVAIAFLSPGLSARGLGVPVATFLGSLALAGHYTGGMPAKTALAIFAAPLAAILVDVLGLGAKPKLAGPLRVALACLPGLILIWLTYEPAADSYY